MSDFEKQVKAFALKAKNNTTAIFHESIIELARETKTTVNNGGNMPIRTGYLRTSLKASTSFMPMINPKSRPDLKRTYSGGSVAIIAAVMRAKMTDAVYLGFEAGYAGYQEDKRGFVRLAAQNWQSIVTKMAAKRRP